MITVSNSEFFANPEMYFDYAREKDEVRVEKGHEVYHIVYETPTLKQPVLEPDDDLRRAISGEEFKQRALETVEKVHRKFYGNEREVSPRRS